jgi:hypothetical protein
MVSFRFFLVSVSAIFLALAVGITVGATVIDKATVDLLHTQIHSADARVAETGRENSDLKTKLKQLNDFDANAAGAFVQGRLTEVPVLVAAVQGDNDDAVRDLRSLLLLAGARVSGIVWFTPKFKLDKADDAVALANALALPAGTTGDVVRHTAITRLASAWSDVSGGAGETILPALQSLGMVKFEAGTSKDVTTVPADRSRFVVAATLNAVVPNDQLGVPLVAELARVMANRVVAVDGIDAGAQQQPMRELLTGPLRADGTLSPRISTVDDIEDIRGRIMTVYALQNLAAGALGHYGVGPHARDQFSLAPQP